MTMGKMEAGNVVQENIENVNSWKLVVLVQKV